MTVFVVAVFVQMADAGWAAPPARPARPPVRVPAPAPEVMPIRPPADVVSPPRAGPSIRSGAAPEEAMHGQSSFRPVPIVPFRARPGSGNDGSVGSSEEGSASSSPMWWLLLIIPVAGGLALLFVVVLLVDVFAKRRRGAASPPPPAVADSSRSHINPRWSAGK